MTHSHEKLLYHGPAAELRGMTARNLEFLGLEVVAYVKPVVIDGVDAYAIHSADGHRLGLALGRNIAMAEILRHELEPVSVH